MGTSSGSNESSRASRTCHLAATISHVGTRAGNRANNARGIIHPYTIYRNLATEIRVAKIFWIIPGHRIFANKNFSPRSQDSKNVWCICYVPIHFHTFPKVCTNVCIHTFFRKIFWSKTTRCPPKVAKWCMAKK